jgi:uncharacterized membrane protein
LYFIIEEVLKKMSKLLIKAFSITGIFIVYFILLNLVISYLTQKFKLNYQVHDSILILGSLVYILGVLSCLLIEKIYTIIGK